MRYETLYARRYVENERDVFEWLRSNGMTPVDIGETMHVTLCYSKRPVEFLQDAPPLPLAAYIYGPTRVETFGRNKDRLALTFQSDQLIADFEILRAAGAKYDYPRFRAHVTLPLIGVDADDVDLMSEYKGVLNFGPCVFSKIKSSKP